LGKQVFEKKINELVEQWGSSLGGLSQSGEEAQNSGGGGRGRNEEGVCIRKVTRTGEEKR